MKLTETIRVPARDEERTIGYRCDVCLAERDQLGWPSREREETTVSTKRSEIYPECGYSEENEWDICPACFDKHIRPVLDALGAKPRTTEASW